MRIAVNYFGSQHNELLYYAQQLGVVHAVGTVPAQSLQPGYVKPWDILPLRIQQKFLEGFGMDLEVLEGIKFIDAAKLGLDGKDECIEQFCRLLKNMSELGIKTVCYNWMPVFGWFRTKHHVPARGNAVATGFNIEDIAGAEYTSAGRVSADRLWTNLEYFMKKVVPVAEKYQVKLALHPDDPPVNGIAGIDRILITADAMWQAINLAPSPYNGIAMCQATFATMGEDVPVQIKRFAERIFFAHIRDIEGTRENFVETFPDNGITNMYEVIKAYHEIGFDGVIRPDHTPTMYGEKNTNPGYAVLGNLFTVGYLKGLIEGVEKGIKTYG